MNGTPMRAETTTVTAANAATEQSLDLSQSRAYDSALDILGAYKLTDNFPVNLGIVLRDLGAAAEVAFAVAPRSALGFHSDCRRVVFRRNANVSEARFIAIMRSVDDRIGFKARPSWWADLLHGWRTAGPALPQRRPATFMPPL
jgi:hypothetical protein